MEEIVKKAFTDSFNSLCSQVNESTYRHINESVYRYLFIQNLPASIGIEDEWRRIDLLLHDSNFQYPIEFKQYDTRPRLNFGKGKNGKKGGAGKRNFDEFLSSAQKLVELKNKEVFLDQGCNFKKCYFVLLAGDKNEIGKKRFDYWYWDQDRHLKALLDIGIQSKIIAREECVKSSLKIFGWIVELYKV
jgi:hypothetical protein